MTMVKNIGGIFMQEKIFAVIGGDLRQAHLANRLAQRGYRVYGVLFDKEVELSSKVVSTAGYKEALGAANVVVLPLPISLDGQTVNAPFGLQELELAKCFRAVEPGAVVMGGRVTAEIAAAARSAGVELIDYLEREELAVLNSVPTAEGAIAIAMNELPTTIFGRNILITGFGRIAKVLARILVAMGANVTVAARKYSDLAWIEIYHCRAIHISLLEDVACEADLVFNTIPAVVLDEGILSRLSRNCLVIDLASKPGGVDFETARCLGIKTIWALSLPGKVAPVFAGEAIKDTILNILDERGL